MFAIPFKLRAKLEKVSRLEGYWDHGEPYWLASLTEHAPGLSPRATLPIEIPIQYTREYAQEFASKQWSLHGIEAVWRKIPKRRAQSALLRAVRLPRTRAKPAKSKADARVEA